MDKQFTASEVRKKEIWLNDAVVRKMLHAFADRLEADEKAEPVAYADAATREEILNVAMRKGGYGCEVPLFVHPAPADAERLAEALRNLVSEWVAIADDGDATLEDSAIGYRACANRLSAMLAAHYAQARPPANLEKMPRMEQLRRFVEWERANNPERTHIAEWALRRIAYLEAQPPAASVTDTLAVFEVVSGVEGPCLTISRKADGKPRHEYRLAGPKPWGGGNTTHSFKVHTRELREQIDAIEAALADQENPNGL